MLQLVEEKLNSVSAERRLLKQWRKVWSDLWRIHTYSQAWSQKYQNIHMLSQLFVYISVWVCNESCVAAIMLCLLCYFTVLEVSGAEGLVSETISWMAKRSLSRCRGLLMPISRWISVSDRADMMAPLFTLARQAATYHAGIPTHSWWESWVRSVRVFGITITLMFDITVLHFVV